MSINLISKKFVKVNDKLFCVPRESNSILEIDINTWETKRLCEMETRKRK